MEFKSFEKIQQIGKVFMRITQKIHGTNAQIVITPELELFVGSRTRWITPENDNYGFATHVYDHKHEFIQKLGIGTHFGEWAGPGINSGEGLPDRVFVLFDFWKFPEGRPMPPQCVAVPVLYQGPVNAAKIDDAMKELQTNGSKLCPGFMRPEGVVIQIANERYKKVFQSEETQWRQGDGDKQKILDLIQEDYSNLLQPIRLEKLLSKDESFTRDYPESLPTLVKSYFADLIEEGQISGTEDELKAVRKGASKQVFNFIRTTMETPRG